MVAVDCGGNSADAAHGHRPQLRVRSDLAISQVAPPLTGRLALAASGARPVLPSRSAFFLGRVRFENMPQVPSHADHDVIETP